MTNLVRIPKRFMDDHAERDLDTPVVVRQTKSHYFIDRNDPAYDELLSDARYYAFEMDNVPELFGLVRSATATFQAMFDG